MTTLAIDTSNELLAVALVQDGQLVGETMTNIKEGQTARLMPAIVSLMEQARVEQDDLSKIVVGRGPGSYTGVRVGITTAKTMAWGLNIPIYPVSSLRALAHNGAFFSGYVMPFFNARRQAVYTGLYRFEAGELREVIAEQHVSLIDWIHKLEREVAGFSEQNLLCLSPHMDVFVDLLREQLGERAVIPGDASHFLRPVHLIEAAEAVATEDVHLVKPNYLRMTEAEANLLKGQKSE